MNKTFLKIFATFLVVALVTSQFWSCSTAQRIVPLHKTIASSDSEHGTEVLLFKLLNPMKPDNGQEVTKLTISEAKHVDDTTNSLTGSIVYYLLAPFLEIKASCFDVPTAIIETCQSPYSTDCLGRAPPLSMII